MFGRVKNFGGKGIQPRQKLFLFLQAETPISIKIAENVECLSVLKIVDEHFSIDPCLAHIAFELHVRQFISRTLE